MPANLDNLNPEFRKEIEALLQSCADKGAAMVPFFADRHPLVQARLWRQSRSRAEIDRKIAELEHQGAEYLAWCLRSVGPQFGRWATNAIPGESWHQYGLAVDCYWLVDGRAMWTPGVEIGGINGYRIYAAEAERLGLVSLSHIGDHVHVGAGNTKKSPLRTFGSYREIDRLMKEKWR